MTNEAIESFQLTVEYDPKNINSHNFKGELFIGVGNILEALKSFDNVLLYDP